MIVARPSQPTRGVRQTAAESGLELRGANVTQRGEAIAAGAFLAVVGTGLVAWNWIWLLMYNEFYPKTAWLGPLIAIYGIAHACYAKEARVLGSPAWANWAWAIGAASGLINWYALCHVLCGGCGLKDCL
jgi:hypothetical protein